LVLPTSGPANCRLHSTVVLACGADSNDHAKLNAVVYCRCRGEQLQDTFARSLHQSSRIASQCANLLLQRSHIRTDWHEPAYLATPSMYVEDLQGLTYGDPGRNGSQCLSASEGFKTERSLHESICSHLPAGRILRSPDWLYGSHRKNEVSLAKDAQTRDSPAHHPSARPANC